MKKIAVIICLSLLAACSKKTITTTYVYSSPGSIVIGQSSANVISTQQNADITQGPGGVQPVGTYALDVNADGQADFSLTVENSYNMASSHLQSAKIDITSLNGNSSVLAQNAYSLRSYTLTYDQPNHQWDTTVTVSNTITKLNPKVLFQGGNISSSDNWQQGTFNLSMYSDNSIVAYTPNLECDGGWLHANSWYIGVKFQNRLGWIKVTANINTAANQAALHVHEFALAQ